ncbi:NAD(P)(+)--arginine ADP-ribosyltransferase 2-like [Chamaea fasciata]|uniref:NAD(P)(+)--arginine ADP-ribosyltransferase 2-like n=1 Tax=Chamaea fasciata TaxID=190680 RepID=UPI00336ACEEF
MAPLVGNLALLAMVMATMAIEVMPRYSSTASDMGCQRAMTELLPALNYSEFQKNPLFARVWVKAMAEWQRWGAPESPLSPAQATAIMAYTMKDMYQEFNAAMRVARHSPQEYRDNFHFKTLHFLLTQAVATLRDAQKWKCTELHQKVCGVQFEAKHGDIVHFGEFLSTLLSETSGNCSWKVTFLHVYTCQGVDIGFFSDNSLNCGLLIPPFETFEVTQITKTRDKAVIYLRSTGTHSINDCEWLQGGSISMAPFHLGGFLLATTVMAVATGIL